MFSNDKFRANDRRRLQIILFKLQTRISFRIDYFTKQINSHNCGLRQFSLAAIKNFTSVELEKTTLTSILAAEPVLRLWSDYKRPKMTLSVENTDLAISLLLLGFRALLHFVFPDVIDRPNCLTVNVYKKKIVITTHYLNYYFTELSFIKIHFQINLSYWMRTSLFGY